MAKAKDQNDKTIAPMPDLANVPFGLLPRKYPTLTREGGARAGSGRKSKEIKEIEYALMNNPEDIGKTWAKMVELAHAGNVDAIRLHLARVFGKEAPHVDPEAAEKELPRVTIIVN